MWGARFERLQLRGLPVQVAARRPCCGLYTRQQHTLTHRTLQPDLRCADCLVCMDFSMQLGVVYASNGGQ